MSPSARAEKRAKARRRNSKQEPRFAMERSESTRMFGDNVSVSGSATTTATSNNNVSDPNLLGAGGGSDANLLGGGGGGAEGGDDDNINDTTMDTSNSTSVDRSSRSNRSALSRSGRRRGSNIMDASHNSGNTSDPLLAAGQDTAQHNTNTSDKGSGNSNNPFATGPFGPTAKNPFGDSDDSDDDDDGGPLSPQDIEQWHEASIGQGDNSLTDDNSLRSNSLTSLNPFLDPSINSLGETTNRDAYGAAENGGEQTDLFTVEPIHKLGNTSRADNEHGHLANSTFTHTTTSSDTTRLADNTNSITKKPYYNLSRAAERNQFMEIMSGNGGGGDGSGSAGGSAGVSDIGGSRHGSLGDGSLGNGSNGDGNATKSPLFESPGDDDELNIQTFKTKSSVDNSMENYGETHSKYEFMKNYGNDNDNDSENDITAGSDFPSMQELLDEEKSRSEDMGRGLQKRGLCGCCDPLLGAKKTKRRKISILILLLLMVCTAAGVMIYFMAFAKNDEEEESSLKNSKMGNTSPSSTPTKSNITAVGGGGDGDGISNNGKINYTLPFPNFPTSSVPSSAPSVVGGYDNGNAATLKLASNIYFEYLNRCAEANLDKDSCLVSNTIDKMDMIDGGGSPSSTEQFGPSVSGNNAQIRRRRKHKEKPTTTRHSKRFLQAVDNDGDECDSAAPPNMNEQDLRDIINGAKAQCILDNSSLSVPELAFENILSGFLKIFDSERCFQQLCEEGTNPSKMFLDVMFDEAAECAQVEVYINQCLLNKTLDQVFEMMFNNDGGVDSDMNISDEAKRIRRMLQESSSSCDQQPSLDEWKVAFGSMLIKAESTCSALGAISGISQQERDGAVSDLAEIFAARDCWPGDTIEGCEEDDTDKSDPTSSEYIDNSAPASSLLTRCYVGSGPMGLSMPLVDFFGSDYQQEEEYICVSFCHDGVSSHTAITRGGLEIYEATYTDGFLSCETDDCNEADACVRMRLSTSDVPSTDPTIVSMSAAPTTTTGPTIVSISLKPTNMNTDVNTSYRPSYAPTFAPTNGMTTDTTASSSAPLTKCWVSDPSSGQEGYSMPIPVIAQDNYVCISYCEDCATTSSADDTSSCTDEQRLDGTKLSMHIGMSHDDVDKTAMTLYATDGFTACYTDDCNKADACITDTAYPTLSTLWPTTSPTTSTKGPSLLTSAAPTMTMSPSSGISSPVVSSSLMPSPSTETVNNATNSTTTNNGTTSSMTPTSSSMPSSSSAPVSSPIVNNNGTMVVNFGVNNTDTSNSTSVPEDTNSSSSLVPTSSLIPSASSMPSSSFVPSLSPSLSGIPSSSVMPTHPAMAVATNETTVVNDTVSVVPGDANSSSYAPTSSFMPSSSFIPSSSPSSSVMPTSSSMPSYPTMVIETTNDTIVSLPTFGVNTTETSNSSSVSNDANSSSFVPTSSLIPSSSSRPSSSLIPSLSPSSSGIPSSSVMPTHPTMAVATNETTVVNDTVSVVPGDANSSSYAPTSSVMPSSSLMPSLSPSSSFMPTSSAMADGTTDPSPLPPASGGNNSSSLNETSMPTFQSSSFMPASTPEPFDIDTSWPTDSPSPPENVTNATNVSVLLDTLSAPYAMSFSMESPSMLSRYGSSVAISGDGSLIAVGSKDATNDVGQATGAVYLYSLDTTIGIANINSLSLLQVLYGQSSGDEFGNAIALSQGGNRLVVGSRSENERTGAMRIYQLDDDMAASSVNATLASGNNTATLSPLKSWSLSDIIAGQNPSERAGWAVSISADGNVIAMGSPKGGTYKGGSILAFKYNVISSGWDPHGSMVRGLSSGEAAGYSISLSGTGSTLVVGIPRAANLDGASNAGKVSVYFMSGSEWQLMGQEVYGESAGEIDGTSVAMSQDGSVLVIGGVGRSEVNASTGEVILKSTGYCRVFQFQSSEWQLQYSIEGKAFEERLGSSVAVSPDGNIVACGGVNGVNGNTKKSGVVRLWNRVTLQESTIWPRERANDSEGATFGASLEISADGEYVIVGAPTWIGTNGGASAGAIQIFRDVS